MEAREVLVAFERIEDDWTEGGPPSERRLTATEGVRSDRDVREIAARLRASIIDNAEIAIEEDTAFRRTPEYS